MLECIVRVTDSSTCRTELALHHWRGSSKKSGYLRPLLIRTPSMKTASRHQRFCLDYPSDPLDSVRSAHVGHYVRIGDWWGHVLSVYSTDLNHR